MPSCYQIVFRYFSSCISFFISICISYQLIRTHNFCHLRLSNMNQFTSRPAPCLDIFICRLVTRLYFVMFLLAFLALFPLAFPISSSGPTTSVIWEYEIQINLQVSLFTPLGRLTDSLIIGLQISQCRWYFYLLETGKIISLWKVRYVGYVTSYYFCYNHYMAGNFWYITYIGRNWIIGRSPLIMRAGSHDPMSIGEATSYSSGD